MPNRLEEMDYLINLKDVLIEQLRDLYSAEHAQHAMLSRMLRKTYSNRFKGVIRDHLQDTDLHIKRLEDIFDKLDVVVYKKAFEADDLAELSGGPNVLDDVLIASIQYMEHFEIAGYVTAYIFANELALSQITKQLYITLIEEKCFNDQLAELGMSVAGRKAASPVDEKIDSTSRNTLI